MLVSLDLLMLVGYLVAIFSFGCWFAWRSSNTDEFMAAERRLPGWAVGLSMFGSYISSISFLGNPGASYDTNWNPFVFSLATPIAAAIAVRWFVPFYRRTGAVSAYEHLEHRFGRWARTYATVCFLLTQVTRTGTVIYLLALAVGPFTHWDSTTTILVAASLMIFCAFTGGITAAVWTGVLQSAVLIAGTLLCLATVIAKTPGGVTQIIEAGSSQGKFGLGSFALDFSAPTFWVLLLYGLVTHLNNFGVDQGFVQRFITARNDREATKSVWLTTALYMPAAAIFFFIGTARFVFYGENPGQLPSGLPADKVFPHFIATQLPPGAAGLVVAAIFAASMDPNLSSMATLTLCDIYKPYFRPDAGERESMFVLRAATLGWGLLSTAVPFLMLGKGSTLNVWWQWAGIFSGGVLGLFLLGLISRKADNASAAIAVVVGVLVIVWMTLPAVLPTVTDRLPAAIVNHWHVHMTMVVGTLVIFLVGQTIAVTFKRTPKQVAAC
jgi:SSS family solute:Na+ symporter